MTQSPLPLLQPAGEPGNLNDVAELRQMLANQTAIAEAARDHVAALEAEREKDKKTIASFRSAEAALREKVESLKEETDQLDKQIENLQQDLSDDEDATAEMEGLLAELEKEIEDQDDVARDIAAVRRMLKGGASHAADELTRILDRSFKEWRRYA